MSWQEQLPGDIPPIPLASLHSSRLSRNIAHDHGQARRQGHQCAYSTPTIDLNRKCSSTSARDRRRSARLRYEVLSPEPEGDIHQPDQNRYFDQWSNDRSERLP